MFLGNALSLVSGPLTSTQRTLALLRRKSAVAWIPGVGTVQGLTALDYLASDLAALTTVDGLVGGVKDSLGGTINALQATAGSRPTLRRGVVNYITHSDGFADGIITPGTGLVVVATGVADQNGSLTARQIRNTITTEQHRLYLNTNGTPRTQWSVRLKNVDAGFVQLSITGIIIAESGANFNLVTGVVDSIASSGAMPTATIVPDGNGFYRCTVIPHASETGINNVQLYILEAGGESITPYTTGTAKSVIVGGVQLGSSDLPYVPTTTAPASSATGPFWLDTTAGTKTLGSTFPAGHESDIVIDAVTNVGATILTGQNLTGAYSVYGGISATELWVPASVGLGSGWSRNGTQFATDGTSANLTLPALTIGKTYQFSVVTSGAVNLFLGSGTYVFGIVGAYSWVATCSNSTSIVIQNSTAGSKTVDLVSVREVLPGTSGRIIIPGTLAAPATLTASEQALLVNYANNKAGV